MEKENIYKKETRRNCVFWLLTVHCSYNMYSMHNERKRRMTSIYFAIKSHFKIEITPSLMWISTSSIMIPSCRSYCKGLMRVSITLSASTLYTYKPIFLYNQCSIFGAIVLICTLHWTALDLAFHLSFILILAVTKQLRFQSTCTLKSKVPAATFDLSFTMLKPIGNT